MKNLIVDLSSSVWYFAGRRICPFVALSRSQQTDKE
jgi:hypothetical protein